MKRYLMTSTIHWMTMASERQKEFLLLLSACSVGGWTGLRRY